MLSSLRMSARQNRAEESKAGFGMSLHSQREVLCCLPPTRSQCTVGLRLEVDPRDPVDFCGSSGDLHRIGITLWLSSQTGLSSGEPWAPAAFSREPQKGQCSIDPGEPLGSLEYGLGTSRPGCSEHQPGGGASGKKLHRGQATVGNPPGGLRSASSSNLSVQGPCIDWNPRFSHRKELEGARDTITGTAASGTHRSSCHFHRSSYLRLSQIKASQM